MTPDPAPASAETLELLPESTSVLRFVYISAPHLPSPSRSVAKLPCDEVAVAKLLATEHFPTLVFLNLSFLVGSVAQ